MNNRVLQTPYLVAAVVAAMLFADATAILKPAQAQGRSSALIEEIVVTARKREENLQDAPITVSAFTGDALDFRGVTDIGKLDQFVDNLTDEQYTIFANYQDGFGFTQQTFHRGREWYIQASYEF